MTHSRKRTCIVALAALLALPFAAGAQDTAPQPVAPAPPATSAPPAPAGDKPTKARKPRAAKPKTDPANGAAAAGNAKAADAGLPRTASVRVLNAVASAPAVDIYIDGNKAVSAAAFKSLSAYLTVPSGKRQLKITASGGTDALATGSITARRGGYYTAYLFKDGDKLALDSLNESSGAALKEGQSRVYVVQLSPGAPAVDLTSPSTRVKSGRASILKNLEFKKPRSKTVNSGDVTLQITNG